MLQVQVKHGLEKECAIHSVTVTGECNPHFERLEVKAAARQTAGKGQAVVRMVASSVNPIDWKIFLWTEPDPMYVPGKDLSGVVTVAGPDCNFRVGDRVWGVGEGVWSEYFLASCDQLALVPSIWTMPEAGAAGAVALVALQALSWAGAPWAATHAPRVLVVGGSSGTGHVGVQMAKAMGAKEVISTCSPGNFDFVRGLGADRVLDYHTQNWWEVLPKGSVDVIYDCIAKQGSGDRAYQVLAPGGKYTTLLPNVVVSPAVEQSRPDLTWHHTSLWQTGREFLDKVGKIAEQGMLNITIDKTFTGLSSISDAMRLTMQGHTVGKNSLLISSD